MKIWIDLENTPHAMVFRPIVRKLQARGHEIIVTAKDYGQITGLLDSFSIPYTIVGQGSKQNRVSKVYSVFQRALMLLKFVRGQNIQLSISHGSRSHIIASYLGRIPSITAYDYEYSSKAMVHELASLVLVPAILKDSPYFHGRSIPANMRFYPGLKEELYLCDFKPPDSPILPIDARSILVVVRPSATTAHYVDPLAEKIFHKIMEIATNFRSEEVIFVLLPRTSNQGEELSKRYKNLGKSIIIPKAPLDGLALLWQADLVISAGGTMNREAALLGVPTYSIFTGPTGAVDQYLINSGRIKHIDSEGKLENIIFRKKDPVHFTTPSCLVLDFFLEQVEQLSHR